MHQTENLFVSRNVDNEGDPLPLSDLEDFPFESLSNSELNDRNLNLNRAAIQQAVRDLIRGNEANMLDAAYFLFSGDQKTIDEMKDPRSFEKFANRLNIQVQPFLSAIWQKLSLDKKQKIINGLESKYHVEVPEFLKNSGL